MQTIKFKHVWSGRLPAVGFSWNNIKDDRHFLVELPQANMSIKGIAMLVKKLLHHWRYAKEVPWVSIHAKKLAFVLTS